MIFSNLIIGKSIQASLTLNEIRRMHMQKTVHFKTLRASLKPLRRRTGCRIYILSRETISTMFSVELREQSLKMTDLKKKKK